MSRPPEVEAAMSYRNGPLSCVLTMSDGSKRYGHEILAAEVERLEKREKELEADLDAYAPPVLQDGRPIFDSFGSKLRRDVRARAEAAERRVALLIHTVAQLSAVLAEAGAPQDPANAIEMAAWAQSVAKAEARVRELEAQNARLRAALERLDALYISEFDHEDRPPRPQWLQEALNGEEAK